MRENSATPNPIPLPAGVDFADVWEDAADTAYRVLLGVNRGVTDSDVIVWTSSIQFPDGSIDTDGKIELPAVHVDGNLASLNSDQARELASALLEASAEADGWAGR